MVLDNLEGERTVIMLWGLLFIFNLLLGGVQCISHSPLSNVHMHVLYVNLSSVSEAEVTLFHQVCYKCWWLGLEGS